MADKGRVAPTGGAIVMSPTWFISDVMKKVAPPAGESPRMRKGRTPNIWCAVLTDVDPKMYPDGSGVPPGQSGQLRWLDLGRHKTREDAWAFAEQQLATRH